MDQEEFTRVFNDQVETCRNILVRKGKEYATADQLHNFKVAAGLQGVEPAEALGGMMAKHTVSVFDLIKQMGAVPLDVWDEKITDHINYLILLKAIAIEQARS